ncbi:MAG: GNAT family N-acetyltransferase [Ilumatobacteraceae bacterium]|nr:GNAT family N-acetyltransferase [Ilumatobacteraceae bacterium]
MTLELVELGPTNFDLLDAIERTPEPTDEWVREVEDFILGPAVRTHLDEPASFIVAVKIDGDVRGAVVHHQLVEYPGSEYISAVLIDHRSRGRGHGRSLVEAVVQHATGASGRSYAVWAVHPGNAVMLELSAAVGEEFAVDGQTGYRFLVAP